MNQENKKKEEEKSMLLLMMMMMSTDTRKPVLFLSSTKLMIAHRAYLSQNVDIFILFLAAS